MKDYIKHHEWDVIEEGFDPKNNRISESIFSLGNGKMGQRANFEEHYSGDSLLGSYIAGVYYPDKTRVGWWKNGYPEYFAKVLNATNWTGIDVEIDGEKLDLAKAKIENFRRVLHMKEGYLERSFVATLQSGKKVEVNTRRFLSIVDTDCGAIEYRVKALNFTGTISLKPYLDLDVENEDSNYDEKFWLEVQRKVTGGEAFITGETKKTGFQVCSGMTFNIKLNGQKVEPVREVIDREKYVANKVNVEVEEGQEVTIEKFISNAISLYYDNKSLEDVSRSAVYKFHDKGFEKTLQEHTHAWAHKWEESDITIEGDVAAQQAIRFNIFHMNQTYTGEDERLNIGPKGFTGEKYGGVTYWDTEAYCLPFYLKTAPPQVARQLLVYRYKHLQKAIENAEKLGFKDGAALYPMVTINGEECHNEWEITFEEIHRNGAIAHAIHNYINNTGDKDYLAEFGLEVLIGISRFWRQRVHWSERRKGYVMLGVTGPNEYENNVNNNWYTNLMAQWTLNYTIKAIEWVRENHPDAMIGIVERTRLNKNEDEVNTFKDIAEKIVLPVDEETGVFIQQDGFFDKELKGVDEIPNGEYPINQNWSWDRILRSCYIKQADVLQGMYFLEDQFDTQTIRKNYDFYEPMTVHESSLSPCIHAILAAKLGYEDRAYKFYLRTSRLDLDDYNNDTEDGLHITSMAGTWMSVVEGFGGVRVKEGELYINPFKPGKWTSFSFKMLFKGVLLKIIVRQNEIDVINESDKDLTFYLFGKSYTAKANDVLKEKYQPTIA